MTKRRILLLGSLVLFIACKPNKGTNSNADSATTKNASALDKSVPATGLPGIWVKENDDNPAFEINQDSVYYP
ncbi:MAG TPA: hypothetical protein VFE54_05065, partial [Mucilaginibacter sp.]|nr:hypothetical protein [Mucilaginibacter sp.]